MSVGERRGELVVRWTEVHEKTSVEEHRSGRGCEWPAINTRCGACVVCRVYVGSGFATAVSGGWMLCRAHTYELLMQAARDGEPVSLRDFKAGPPKGEPPGKPKGDPK